MNVLDFPQEILEQVLDHLDDINDVFALRLTCQEMRSRIPCLQEANDRVLRFYAEKGFRLSSKQIEDNWTKRYLPMMEKAVSNDDLTVVMLLENLAMPKMGGLCFTLAFWQLRANKERKDGKVLAHLTEKARKEKAIYEILLQSVFNPVYIPPFYA